VEKFAAGVAALSVVASTRRMPEIVEWNGDFIQVCEEFSA
jgi:hypothetical protein